MFSVTKYAICRKERPTPLRRLTVSGLSSVTRPLRTRGRVVLGFLPACDIASSLLVSAVSRRELFGG
jgi:hypothetical protein